MTVLLLFPTQSRLLTTLSKKPLENIVGKGENAGYQHFLLFPQCFEPYQRQKSSVKLILFCRLQTLSIWTGREFCRLVKSSAVQTCQNQKAKRTWIVMDRQPKPVR